MVEQPPALLEGQNGVLKGSSIRILHNLGNLILGLLDGGLESGQIVRRLDLTEVGGTQEETALLQQRVLALCLLTGT